MWLAAALLPAVAAAQPHAVFHAFNRPGLTLTKTGPGTAILVNRDDRAVLLVAFRCRFVTKTGQSIATSERYENPVEPEKPVLAGHAGMKIDIKGFNAMIDRADEGQPIDVGLDTVIYADGEVAGPDESESRALFDAQLRARRDVLSRTAGLMNTGTWSDARLWLGTLADREPRNAYDTHCALQAKLLIRMRLDEGYIQRALAAPAIKLH